MGINFVFFPREYRLIGFENKVLRRTYGPRRQELTGECRQLHHGELHIVT
jgi:hypothetical protein